MPEDFPAVIGGVIGEKIRVAVDVDHPVLRAASESAIVAVKFRPHRQCRMAVSGPLGRVKTGLGGYGDSFGQLASGKAYALIAPLKTGKTNACGRGLAARTRTFEIKLIFG